MNKLYINEIFESVQGEGYNVGRLAIFVRFAGCNLQCDFCDTKYAWEKDSAIYKEDPAGLIQHIKGMDFKSKFIILTGGEPLTQDFKALCEFVLLLKEEGYEVALETNGSIEFEPIHLAVDWIVVSPKQMPFAMHSGDELKLLYTGDEDLEWYGNLRFKEFYLQPVLPNTPLTQYPSRTMQLEYKAAFEQTLQAIKKNPKWRLSFQAHKLAGIR